MMNVECCSQEVWEGESRPSSPREEPVRQLEEQVARLSALPTQLAHALADPLSFMLSNLAFVREELGEGSSLEAVREALAETQEGAQRLMLLLEELRKWPVQARPQECSH